MDAWSLSSEVMVRISFAARATAGWSASGNLNATCSLDSIGDRGYLIRQRLALSS